MAIQAVDLTADAVLVAGAPMGSGLADADRGAPTASDPAAPVVDEPTASQLAVAVAAQAMDDDADRTELRLYRFNRSPWSRIDERRLGGVHGRDHLLRAAGLDRAGTSGGHRLSTLDSGWLYWRHPSAQDWRRAGGATRKLYLAPRLTALEGALRHWASVAAELEVPVFKFPADYPGWRRPDRVVAYVRDREHAAQVAAALGTDWACGAVDEVPFAEPLRPGVFAGLDPDRHSAAAVEGASWRRWTSHLIAGALHAHAGAPVAERVAAAGAALAERGVDPAGFAVPDEFFDTEPDRG